MSDLLKQEYEILTQGSGFVDLPNQNFVRLTGDDRQSFFHNFCTNEIKQLSPGDVCEAFVLNTKGKILGFVHVLALENRLILSGHGPQAATLIDHLDMYLIREDVELVDATNSIGAVFVSGSQAERTLGSGIPLPSRDKSTQATLGSVPVTIANIELAGYGYLVTFPKRDASAVKLALVNLELTECSIEALNVVRVEQKTPWFGIDVDDSNLPQELQRDDVAINFNKGCYLGQETVARIDARGRVNQLLVGLKFVGEPPQPGDELISDEKAVGRITSVVHSFAQDGPVGLGYVRRNFQDSGTRIGNAIVD